LILQALYDLARDEGLMEDPDFEWKPVAWLVALGGSGNLLGIQGTHTIQETDEPEEGKKKKKPKPRPKNFAVPREPGRTSGDRAFLLYDKSEYALGLDPEPDPAKRRPPEKLASRLALFRDRAEACLAATGDDGVRAVCAFLDRLQRGEIRVELPEGCASNDLFGFVLWNDRERLVTSLPLVQDYWRSLRARAEEAESELSLCLVTGRMAIPVDKLPGIKNVPGGSTSGIALVSFNSNAFESYGWSGNENAPISREAAEACSTALNRLLHPAFPDPRQPGQTLPPRNLRLSADTAVCFWSSEPAGDDLTSYLAALLDANPEQVRALYQSLWRGERIAIEDPSRFYALTLSGAQGRAILRDWFETTVADAAKNLADHFADLAIVRNTPPPRAGGHPPALPFRVLMRSLAPRGDDKGVPAALAGQFVRSALGGAPYPFGILQRALERARAEIGRSEWSDLDRADARAALVKAVLVRRRRAQQADSSYPEIREAMDPNNHEAGYLLGRLMALLELMQQLALGGDVNATVVDRFFSAASATPRVAFLRLLKGFRHHARKAEDDPRVAELARRIDRRVDEVVSLLGEHHGGIPSHLSLESQGHFLLGFHQQRHLLRREHWAHTRNPQAQSAAEA
jgi:CRISPR-associated protein Csd1